MKTYEMMLVLRSEFDTGDADKTKALVQKLVGSEVEISKITPLGKKVLAYPIKKLKEGVYIVVKLKGAGIRVSDIEKQARLNEQVLRYLLLNSA